MAHNFKVLQALHLKPAPAGEAHVTGANAGRNSDNLGYIKMSDGPLGGVMEILKTNGDAGAKTIGDLTMLDVGGIVALGNECIQHATGGFGYLVGGWVEAPDGSAGDNPRAFVRFWGRQTINLTAGNTHAADPTDATNVLVPANASDDAAAASPSAADLSDLHHHRFARVLTAVGSGDVTADVLWRMSPL